MNKLFLGSDSGKSYVIEKSLGGGGQGEVFLVNDSDDNKKYAAKWYNPKTSSEQQYSQIQELIKRGDPKTDDPGIHFIWPIESLSFEDSEGFGYLMPLVDTDKFVTPHQIFDRQVKQPKLLMLCRISRRLVAALDTLHASGLAYCDINQGNIMVDPINGEIVIYDNDNIIINNANTLILGVHEYMAPEVALGQSMPNAESDLYSAAILLYYLWMWEHPMYGKATDQIRSLDIVAKEKIYAETPLFVFHPEDNSNTAHDVDILATHVARWDRMCPPKLQAMFTETFVNGVHEPSKRTRLPDWQRAFLELEANTPTCSCGAMNLWDGISTPLICWKCQQETPLQLSLRVKHNHVGDSILLACPDALLRQHHLDLTHFNADSSEVVGRIEQHPQAKGHVILRNLSNTSWGFNDPDGNLLQLEPNQARVIMPGVELTIGNRTIQVQTV